MPGQWAGFVVEDPEILDGHVAGDLFGLPDRSELRQRREVAPVDRPAEGGLDEAQVLGDRRGGDRGARFLAGVVAPASDEGVDHPRVDRLDPRDSGVLLELLQ